MERLRALILIFSTLFAPKILAYAPSSAVELNPVRVHVDKSDRIHLSYQKECGSSFAGFVLRTTAENELFVAVLSYRPSKRCLELTPMEEVIVPHLRGSSFAAVESLNPSLEPVYLKLSPVQNFNQVKDGEDIRLEAAYTSQCATQLGLTLFPGAAGYELSVLEGRSSKFDTCNRSTKLASFINLDLSGAPLRANTQFLEDEGNPLPFTLRRSQTKLIPMDGYHKLYYFRRCSEAPIGLIRQKTDRGLEISVLLANYPNMRCPEGAPDRIWTLWGERVYDKNPLAFEGARVREDLIVKRPISYNYTSDTLSVVSYGSCQKDVGLLSRTTKGGYAVGILQIQSSSPCNSSMKEVSLSFDWNFAHGVKRDIKPLQLVGS